MYKSVGQGKSDQFFVVFAKNRLLVGAEFEKFATLGLWVAKDSEFVVYICCNFVMIIFCLYDIFLCENVGGVWVF